VAVAAGTLDLLSAYSYNWPNPAQLINGILSLSYNGGAPIDIQMPSTLLNPQAVCDAINSVIYAGSNAWGKAVLYTRDATTQNCLMISTIAAGSSESIGIGSGGISSALGLPAGTEVTGSSGAVSNIAVVMGDGLSIGILPVGLNTMLVSYQAGPGGPVFSTALSTLYPSRTSTPPWVNSEGYYINVTSRDVTSASVDSQGGWIALRPILDPIFDVVQTLDGLQIGFYDGVVMMNSPVFNSLLYDAMMIGGYDFNPEIDVHLQVGSRSLGTARCYFMDPTSFEVGQDSVFTYTAANGSILNFIPDPMNNYLFIPQPPNGTKPLDGFTGPSLPGSNYFQSASTNFVTAGVLPGDFLILDYIPLVGSAITAPGTTSGYIENLAGLTLELSLDGGPTQTVIFVQDTPNIPSGAVSLQGIANEINATVGSTIASITSSAPIVLTFNPTVSLVLFPEGTATATLGFTSMDAVSNQSPNAGTYIISWIAALTPSPDVTQIEISSSLSALSNQQFSIVRPGVQRCCSTLMSTQVETASLYYFDVVLLSQGTGDQYNLSYMTPLSVTGYRSDGYWLTTDNPNLTFSPVELPKLHLSPTILEVGVNDSPLNSTQLTGQNIQLNYEYSSLVDNVDTYIRSDTERVVCESTLGRHLIPYFVRFSLNYSGGSAVSLVTSDIENYILGLDPDDLLTVSAVERLVDNRGAGSVSNPIDLIALIHNFDRSITVERSQDYLNTGTLAAFFPDVLDITQSLST
jgi:hypothetical protein